MEQEPFSPTFNAIFPTLDEMIKDFHPDIRVRKIYTFMRTQGLSQEEAREYVNNLLSDLTTS